MKVVIQEHDTDRFYKAHGTWTNKREEAAAFDTSIDALKKVKAEHLHADVVLAFPDPTYDVKMSTRPK